MKLLDPILLRPGERTISVGKPIGMTGAAAPLRLVRAVGVEERGRTVRKGVTLTERMR